MGMGAFMGANSPSMKTNRTIVPHKDPGGAVVKAQGGGGGLYRNAGVHTRFL